MKIKDLVYFGLLSLACSCGRIRVENYYLPEGFEGDVAIIYKNNGSKTKDTQNWIIPRNGILRTNQKFLAGKYITHYYQKNTLNSYDTLPYDFKIKDTTKNEVVFPRILTFQKGNSTESFTVFTFYVGKRRVEDLEKERTLFERKLENLLIENNN